MAVLSRAFVAMRLLSFCRDLPVSSRTAMMLRALVVLAIAMAVTLPLLA